MYAPPVPGSGVAPNAVVRLDIPIDDVVKVRIIYGPIRELRVLTLIIMRKVFGYWEQEPV